MGLVSDVRKAIRLVGKAVESRTATIAVRRALSKRPTSTPEDYRIAVYFADGDVNMYQIRQWYGPLRRLAETWPVVVMSRVSTGAKAILDDGALPVAFLPSVRQIERFIAEHDIRIVFYVNQNTRNFQMFRYGRRWHVFINHGESDKMYMTTNQYKAYDFAFIAGDAARERLRRVLWDYDIDRRAIAIGRPQADHFSGELPYEPDDRTVVLYAPTWEGDRPSAHYGSIVTHGEAIVTAVLARPDLRLIYRPHPRSGVVDRAYAAAHRRIVAAIAAANSADQSAHHVFDDGPDLGWQLAAADVAVVDISAMVYDRLATGKPLLVTRPADPEATIDTHGYLSACEWLDASAAPAIGDEIARVQVDEGAAARLQHWVTHYFGDTTEGVASDRFHTAVSDLMDQWETWHDLAVAHGDADEPEAEAELDDEPSAG